MKHKLNYFFAIPSAILLFFGILFQATLSAPVSLKLFGNTHYFLFHQLTAVAIGLIAGFIVFKLPPPWLQKLAPWLFFANLALLSLVFLPSFGLKFLGAKRWIG